MVAGIQEPMIITNQPIKRKREEEESGGTMEAWKGWLHFVESLWIPTTHISNTTVATSPYVGCEKKQRVRFYGSNTVPSVDENVLQKSFNLIVSAM